MLLQRQRRQQRQRQQLRLQRTCQALMKCLDLHGATSQIPPKSLKRVRTFCTAEGHAKATSSYARHVFTITEALNDCMNYRCSSFVL